MHDVCSEELDALTEMDPREYTVEQIGPDRFRVTMAREARAVNASSYAYNAALRAGCEFSQASRIAIEVAESVRGEAL